MKRTLKRELKVPEIAEREANGTSLAWEVWRAKVIACCFNASVAVGFDLVARGVSRLVCQRQFTIEENYRDMVSLLRGSERAC